MTNYEKRTLGLIMNIKIERQILDENLQIMLSYILGLFLFYHDQFHPSYLIHTNTPK